MIINVIRKELMSMFASPMGWVILSLLMLVLGFFYLNGIDSYFAEMSGSIRPAERVGATQAIGQKLFSTTVVLLLFAVSLLSMRLISEERRNLTLPFLFSAPISIVDIVLGKFLGMVIFLSSLVVYIVIMLFSLMPWVEVDIGYIWANAFGLMLMIGAFSSAGLYFSSLTKQPVVAAVICFLALLALLLLDWIFSGSIGIWSNLSITARYNSFASGLIDTGDIAYFVLFMVTFVTLTIRRLDADRLRG